MSVTEEIKARLDIVQYIQQYVPDLKRIGRYFKAPCPFHHERTPSFVVNADTQSWRCFGACAEGGDIFSFAMKKQGWSFAEAVQELAVLAGIELEAPSEQQKERAVYLDRLRGMLQTAAELYHQHLLDATNSDSQKVMRYLQDKRGLSPQTLERFMIGYAPDSWHYLSQTLETLGYKADEILAAGLGSQNDQGKRYDRFRQRLMIPIRDERGRVIGFGARALKQGDEPKYLNSPQSEIFDKSKVLFALDHAKHSIRDLEYAVIVEGYMDAIQAHQAGYPNVVAQMGTALTEMQLRLLVPRLTQKVIMALDADPAGQNATRRSLEVAREALAADYAGRLTVELRVLQIPDAKDPDDFLRESPDGWQMLISQAQPVADFVIDLETATLSPNATIQEREALARRVLPILAASEDDLYRQDNLQKLATRLKMKETILLGWAQQHRTKPSAPRTTTATTSSDTGKHDQPTTPLALRDGRAVEAYCLRLLLRYPRMLIHANRELSLLAGDNAELWSGPLSTLSSHDFNQSDYRLLMGWLERAILQDGYDPLDYIRQQVDERLRRELDLLLVADQEAIQLQVGQRYSPDMLSILKQTRHHQGLTQYQLQHEVTRCVLIIRERRLQEESEALRFLIQEQPLNTDYSLHTQVQTLLSALTVIRRNLQDRFQRL